MNDVPKERSEEWSDEEWQEATLKKMKPIPPARKAIQISSVMDSVGKYLILCLCDDGTIWQLSNLYCEDGGDPKWERFIQPPQD